MSLRPSERAELRRSDFKASAVEGEAGRQRRENITVEIRKASRDSALWRRRQEAAAEGSEAGVAPHAPLAIIDRNRMLADLPLLVQRLRSNESRTQLEAVRELGKLLSIENPPIEEVIAIGVLPCFVELLYREDSPALQFEATWALTKIILETPQEIEVVVGHNVIPFFVKFLSSPNEDILEQAVWALGNVACDSYSSRDIVLQHGALVPLLQLFNGRTKLAILWKATWALGIFCRSLPPDKFEHVKPAFPILQQLIHSQDEKIISVACWALADLSSDGYGHMQAVIESGAFPRLVELLIHSSPSVLSPALHVIGNIARGGYAHVQCIIDHQALPRFSNILTTNQTKCIKDEVCLTISSIMAGNKDQIQAVINANIVGQLVHLMQTGEFDVKRIAALAISSATACRAHDQISHLVSQGCIEAFCNLLGYADTGVLVICLKGLENILRNGEAKEPVQLCRVNMYAQMIHDTDGLDKIENLLTHENDTISETAARLLKSYWLEEDTLPFGIDFDPTNLPGDFDFG